MAESTLTTVILVHNQAEQVADLLATVSRQSDQIILLDDNSTDNLTALAEQYGAQIKRHKLGNNFAAHRNWVLTQITTDWTLFLDADEQCSPALWSQIKQAIASNQVDAIWLRRQDWFLGQKLRHGEVGQITLLRCARTKLGKGKWQRPIHETWVVPTHRSVILPTPLEHRPHPTLTSFLNKLHWYASLEPVSRPRYSLVRFIGEMLIFPLAKFSQNYFWRLGWLDGWPGLVHASLMSYYSLITRVFIYEAQYTHHS